MDGVVFGWAGDERDFNLVVEVDEVCGGGESEDEKGERGPRGDEDENEDRGVSHG